MHESRSAPPHPQRTPDALVDGDGVQLACYHDGVPRRPVLLFVHGYPDTAAVWDRLIAELSGEYYCIRYDVRGAGQSSQPHATRDYRLAHLEQDLIAVLDWIGQYVTGPVHLVAHDWGSIQSWEAATDPALAGRLASFTTLSGPCLDHLGQALRRPRREGRPALRRQAWRSWYIAVFQIPGLAEWVWRRLIAPRWPRTLERLEGQHLAVAPSLVADGVHGIRLYRANVLAILCRPRRRPAVVPVHAIVSRRDPFVGSALAETLLDWVDDLEISYIEASHWAIATQAPHIADLCRTYFRSR